jgi:hypothetical protein
MVKKRLLIRTSIAGDIVQQGVNNFGNNSPSPLLILLIMSQCPPIDHVLHSTMLSVLPSRGESVPHIDLFNFPELSTIFLTLTEKEISFQRERVT